MQFGFGEKQHTNRACKGLECQAPSKTKNMSKKKRIRMCVFFHQFEFEICLLLKPVVIQKHHVESLLPLQWDYYLLMAKDLSEKNIHPLQESYQKLVYNSSTIISFLKDIFPLHMCAFFSRLSTIKPNLWNFHPQKNPGYSPSLTGMRAIIVTCSPTG